MKIISITTSSPKRWLPMVFLLITGAFAFGQTPMAFNYQAVARNASQEPLTDTELGLRISIVEATNHATILYTETHHVTTSPIGLFNIAIGNGAPVSGDFQAIDWGASVLEMHVELDAAGGTSYSSLGFVPLLSVPYALYAERTANTDDADADPTNELQSLAIEGNVLSLSNGNAINLPIPDSVGAVDADADPNNEIQNLTVTQNETTINLGLTKGGTGVTFSVADQDNSSDNEIQQLSLVGRGLSLSKNGGAIDLPVDDDADPGNEIQHLTLDGNNLHLDNGGGTVVLPAAAPQTLNLSGTNLSISDGNQVDLSSIQDGVDDADNDPQNEIQQLTLTTLLDAGIDNSTLYQLNLTGNADPVTLPIPTYWNATYFLTEPPSIANIYTSYPVDVQNVITSNGLETQNIVANDLVLGDPAIQALHLFGSEMHFDRPDGNDLGFKFTPDQITYTDAFPETRVTLNKESLQFVNGAGWASTKLGGTTTGKLELFPGGGLGSYLATNYTSQGGGELQVSGPSGRNVLLSHLTDHADNGYVAVYNGSNQIKAGIYINAAGQGVIFGDMKNFVTDDPTEPDKVISYVSLEGPEAAAYCRGTIKLENGRGEVTFPDHFQKIINDQTMTVVLTPLSADSKGLAVIKKDATGIVVQELWQGTGNYELDWEVKAVRKGFENHQPVIPRASILPAKQN